MKKIIICVCVVISISIGVLVGKMINNNYNNNTESYNTKNLNESLEYTNNIEISSITTSGAEEEKTTPNTLIIYKTYYTKCKHYVQEYEEIDFSLVNCNEEEIKENMRGKWDVEKFSSEEIEVSKEIEDFCNQHYKLKLENDVVVIYTIDEKGEETEYEITNITTEYLTQEDILRLKTGILIYGKENLTSTIEDYE